MTNPMPQRLATHAPIGSLLKRAQTQQPRRQAGRFSVQMRDENHLTQIRQLPCLKCGMEPCLEASHVRQNSAAHGKRQAMGQRPSDNWVMPLCPACHHSDPDSLHRVGEQNFFATLGINPFLIATALYAASGDITRMRAIVLAAIAERSS